MSQWELVLDHDYRCGSSEDRSMNGHDGISNAPVEEMAGKKGFIFSNARKTLMVPFWENTQKVPGVRVEVDCLFGRRGPLMTASNRNIVNSFGCFFIGVNAGDHLFVSIGRGGPDSSLGLEQKVPLDKWVKVTFEYTPFGQARLSLDNVSTERQGLGFSFPWLSRAGIEIGGITLQGRGAFPSAMCIGAVRIYRPMPVSLPLVFTKDNKLTDKQRKASDELTRFLSDPTIKKQMTKYRDGLVAALRELVISGCRNKPHLAKEMRLLGAKFTEVVDKRQKKGPGSVTAEMADLATKMMTLLKTEIPREERTAAIRKFSDWEKRNPAPESVLKTRASAKVIDPEVFKIETSFRSAIKQHILSDIPENLWPGEYK